MFPFCFCNSCPCFYARAGEIKCICLLSLFTFSHSQIQIVMNTISLRKIVMKGIVIIFIMILSNLCHAIIVRISVSKCTYASEQSANPCMNPCLKPCLNPCLMINCASNEVEASLNSLIFHILSNWRLITGDAQSILGVGPVN